MSMRLLGGMVMTTKLSGIDMERTIYDHIITRCAKILLSQDIIRDRSPIWMQIRDENVSVVLANIKLEVRVRSATSS
jgi:hypothetical protein